MFRSPELVVVEVVVEDAEDELLLEAVDTLELDDDIILLVDAAELEDELTEDTVELEDDAEDDEVVVVECEVLDTA